MLHMKECPFCGNHDLEGDTPIDPAEVSGTLDGGKHFLQSGCEKCGTTGPQLVIAGARPTSDEIQESVKAWNKRPAVAGLDGAKDCLMKALLGGLMRNREVLAIALDKAVQLQLVRVVQDGDATHIQVVEDDSAGEPRYFIRSHERGYWGNSPVWWGPNSRGYTAHLDQAGRYTWEQCVQICKLDPETGRREDGLSFSEAGGDEPFRCSPLLAIAHHIVDSQDFAAAGIQGGR